MLDPEVRVFYWTRSDYFHKAPTLEEFRRDYREVPLRPIVPECDTLFEQLNKDDSPLGSDGWQQWIGRNLQPSPHTSMSTGDIVQVGSGLWLCKDIGWEKLPFPAEQTS